MYILLNILLSVLVFAEEPIHVDHWRTKEQIDQHYCRVTTGSKESLARQPCFTPNYFDLDVVYLPKSMGEKILSHVQSAYQQKLYHDISLSDFFHGHMATRGPQTHYSSPAEYFNDVVAMLYHSDEYTNRWRWDKTIPRSFFGWLGESLITPAIDLLAPSVRIGNYESSGTIYLDQILESIPDLTLRPENKDVITHMVTCKDCKPCEVQNQVYIIKDLKGRFLTSNQERVELFTHCKYPRPY